VSFEGHGEYIWANGNSYLGEFKNGQQNGYGVWKKNQKKADGEVHEGIFVNGNKNGIGITKFSNGNFYKGHFYQNQRQGYGEMHWLTKKCSYRGEWANGLQHGLGILEFEAETDPFFGLFVKGVYTEEMNMESKKESVDRLNNQRMKLEEELNKFRSEHFKRGNVSKILGDTINQIYDKKLYEIGKNKLSHGKRHLGELSKHRTMREKSPNNRDGSQNKLPSRNILKTSVKQPGPLKSRNHHLNMNHRSFNNDSISVENHPRNLSTNLHPRNSSGHKPKSEKDKEMKNGKYKFYKGRTTYLDGLIKNKLEIQASRGMPKLVNIQNTNKAKAQENGDKPAWKPSGKSSQPLQDNLIF
jgi:hypothetical protein